jgi:hypothetical protein
MNLAELKGKLAQYRYRFDNEADLQSKVETALKAIGVDYEREFVLDPKNRIDFLVGSVGVEIKTNGALNEVTRQVHRYLGFESIGSLLLVTTKVTHKRLVRSMQGKELDVLVVGGFL